MKKDTVVVFHAATARKLLQQGFRLLDIKPDKTDASRERSVFIFERNADLMELLRNQTEDKKGENI